MPTLRVLNLAVALLGLPMAGHAATWHVATNGLDTPGCGSRSQACRSISHAIGLASAGDTISVGPGRYGDADADGFFNRPGDEWAEQGSGCYCVLNINKPVRVISTDGALATMIGGHHAGPIDRGANHGLESGAGPRGHEKSFAW